MFVGNAAGVVGPATLTRRLLPIGVLLESPCPSFPGWNIAIWYLVITSSVQNPTPYARPQGFSSWLLGL